MHSFPFGQPVRRVVQRDQAPKDVFVLGVYASAVHARWIGDDGKERIRAVGVASEPEIFWSGNGAASIVAEVELPPGTGRLEVAAQQSNGPSGRSLDEQFLRPLGVDRSNAWLCDLLPESRCNPSQAKALERAYAPLQHRLPEYSWPGVPTEIADADRVEEIADELVRSRARMLVTLGDLPLQHFAAHFGARRALRMYGTTDAEYGQPVPISVRGHACELLPLVHPRQASSLGRSSKVWSDLHGGWVRKHLGPKP